MEDLSDYNIGSRRKPALLIAFIILTSLLFLINVALSEIDFYTIHKKQASSTGRTWYYNLFSDTVPVNSALPIISLIGGHFILFLSLFFSCYFISLFLRKESSSIFARIFFVAISLSLLFIGSGINIGLIPSSNAFINRGLSESLLLFGAIIFVGVFILGLIFSWNKILCAKILKTIGWFMLIIEFLYLILAQFIKYGFG